jgi:hypothetical protein
MMRAQKARFHLSLLIGMAVVITAMLILPSQTYAGLPPRPPTPPPPVPSPTPEPPAGTLLLTTQPAVDGLWSVVQWQDGDGVWQDVAGWRGAVDDGETIWWVEADNWGKEPFRWAVYRAQDGPLLAVSESFALPGSGVKRVVALDLP